MGSVTSKQPPPKPKPRWEWRLVKEDGQLVRKLVNSHDLSKK
jgi:hypothetical protein